MNEEKYLTYEQAQKKHLRTMFWLGFWAQFFQIVAIVSFVACVYFIYIVITGG